MKFWRNERFKRFLDRFIEGLNIGVGMAISLIAITIALIVLTGNQQQRTLEDVRNTTRAQVCVLLLPVNEQGRDEAATNTRCLIPNGIEPVDADDDGKVELEDGS